MIYLTLFYEFCKIGLFSIGGGLATLPYLRRLTDKYNWFTNDMLVDMIAISESTPGPFGINMATYAGYNAAKISGAVIATLGIMFPAFFIMAAVAKMLNAFKDSIYINKAFYGLRPAVAALIAAAAIDIIKITLINIPAFQTEKNILALIDYKLFILFAIVFAVLQFTKTHPVFFIAVSAIIGVIIKL